MWCFSRFFIQLFNIVKNIYIFWQLKFSSFTMARLVLHQIFRLAKTVIRLTTFVREMIKNRNKIITIELKNKIKKWKNSLYLFWAIEASIGHCNCGQQGAKRNASNFIHANFEWENFAQRVNITGNTTKCERRENPSRFLKIYFDNI